MKKQKKSILITLAFFISLITTTYSQGELYTSYEDYINKTPTEIFDTYEGDFESGKTVTVTFKKTNGEKVKINCADVWGFSFKGELFRIAHNKLNKPVRLIKNSKICYYEDGRLHLLLLAWGMDKRPLSTDPICYFSASIDSQIEVVPTSPQSSANKLLVDFQQSHPEYADLFTCIGENYLYTHVAECVNDF